MPAAKSPSGLYSVHPGLGMVEKWKNELPANEFEEACTVFS